MNHLEFKGTGVAVKPITVFLHGFPGVRSKQNREIAEQTAQTTGRHCYVPLYTGLGFSEGTFSFENCRKEVEDFVGELMKSHGQLDLVGHSWGGYQALGLAAKHGHKIRRLVLMSPLLDFFNVDIADESFKSTAQNNPQLHLGEISKLAEEFVNVGAETPAVSLAERVHPLTKVVLLQAKDDGVTPPKHAEALLSHFRELPIYRTLETDHSFVLNREFATQEIIRALEMGVSDDPE